MTAYLIQVSVALILFYGSYVLFLRRETDFRLARFFLVFALLASVSLPLIDTHNLTSIFISGSETIYEYWMPDVPVRATRITTVAEPSNPFIIIFELIYFLGVLLTSVRLFIPLIKLNNMVRHATMRQDNLGWYYVLEDSNGSFSFFNHIFIGSKSWHSEVDKEKILAHERAHVKNWHSLDVLLVQLLTVLIWFNPIIYWYRKALEQLHEYEADLVASQYKTDEYCELLAKDILDSVQLSIANHFNKSLTLKRIDMIKSIKSKMSWFKKLSLISSVLLIVVLMACEDKIMTDMRRASKQSVLLTEYPPEVEKAINEIKIKNPNVKPQVYGLVRTKDIEDLDLGGQTATMIFVDNDPDYKLYAILGLEEVKKVTDALAERYTEEPIFTIVQDPAAPKNGMTEFYKFIRENLLYPKEARQAGVEGRVFVRFMVNKIGQLSSFQVIRGIGMGCDEEAIRVLSTSPSWKPGMHEGVSVNSFFNLAIVFKLNNDADNSGSVLTPTIRKEFSDSGEVLEVPSEIQDPPSPIDGMDEFYRYVKSKLKYPEQARRMGVEGRVFVKFVVDERGALSNFEVVKGIGAGCDEEALRLLRLAPNWDPGRQNGVAVKSTFNLSIIFKLNSVKEGD